MLRATSTVAEKEEEEKKNGIFFFKHMTLVSTWLCCCRVGGAAQAEIRAVIGVILAKWAWDAAHIIKARREVARVAGHGQI